VSDPLRERLGVERVGTGRWELDAAPHLCAGDASLFGGVLAGAVACAATEDVPDAELRLMHIRFLAPTRRGERVVLEGDRTETGRSAMDFHFLCRGRDGPVARASAHLAVARPHAWQRPPRDREPPRVPAADECPPRRYRWPDPASIMSWLDVRIARAPDPGGTSAALWVRLIGIDDPTPGSLSLIADHFAYVVGAVAGPAFVPRTIEHTLRFCAPGHGTWVLVEVDVSCGSGAMTHGRAQLWSCEGDLLALAEQSLTLVRSDGSNPSFRAASSEGSR
jgi:acyl-CoA thioesterase